MTRAAGFAFAAVVLFAPAARADGPPVEIGFSLLGGVGRRDLGELDDQLASAGFRRLSSTYTSIGMAAEGYVGRALFGTELRFDSVPDAPSLDGARHASLGAESIVLGGGYAIYRDRRLRVFPWLGMGYASAQLLAPPPMVHGDDDRLGESSLLLSPALGFDTLLVPNAPDAETGLFLGLRLGYAFAAPLHDWSGSALATPSLALPGPSLRIVLGYRITVGHETTDDVEP